MKRWNGWGDQGIEMKLPAPAKAMLVESLGPGSAQKSISRQELLAKVPESRLQDPIACISLEPGQRLDHSHGQSFPDWVGMRMGSLRSFPDAVAFPENEAQMSEVMELIQARDLVAIPYGGGTSVVGHLNVPQSARPVLSVSLERMRRTLELDTFSRLAAFEAGITGGEIEAALRPRGFTLGHYPQSFEYSTLGGWVATRSSGQQSLFFGRIEELFAGGKVLTPQGCLELQPFPASAAGPDLRQLFLGSEGRMGILTHAWVRIRALPQQDQLHGLFFPSWEAAVSCARELAGAALPLSMIRMSNPMETRVSLLLAGQQSRTWLLDRYLDLRRLQRHSRCMGLVGLMGDEGVVRAGKNVALKIIKRHGGLCLGQTMGRTWKRNRFLAPYLRNTLWDLGYGVDTLETAFTWDRVTAAVEAVEQAIREALAPFGEKVLVFSHLSHVYNTGSSLYTTLLFRLTDSPQENLQRWKSMKEAASLAILKEGGTISHQHGVGVDHREYLEAEKGNLGIQILRRVFSGLDPQERFNPGKLLG